MKTWIAPVQSKVSHILERGLTLHGLLLATITEMGIDKWVDKLDGAFPYISWRRVSQGV